MPNISDIILKLESYNNRFKLALKKKVELMRLRYEKCMNSRVFKEPTQKINEKYMIIDLKVKSIQNSINNRITKSKADAVKLIAKLDALSPLKTLTRGYSIAEKDGRVVSKLDDANINDVLELRLIDGKLKTKVLEKIK